MDIRKIENVQWRLTKAILPQLPYNITSFNIGDATNNGGLNYLL